MNDFEVLAVYFGTAAAAGATFMIYYLGRHDSKLKLRWTTVATSLSKAFETSRKADTHSVHNVDTAVSLDKLRLQVWKSRRRKVRLLGRAYLVGGAFSLIVGYFTGYFGFEIVSATMIPLGVFFTFSGIEPYMKSATAGQSVISTMRVLNEALKANSEEGHAVFVPGKEDRADVTMFIPKSDTPGGSFPGDVELGHYYTPLGHDLFKTYLREAGGKTETKLSPLLEQLRIIATSGLDLVDDVAFDQEGQEIWIRLKNATFAEIGRYPDLVQGVYCKAGCPVTSSMAEWVAYGTGIRVRWVDAEIDPVSRNALIKLRLMPD